MILITLGLLASSVNAGNDPSIKGKLREDIQQAMHNHIAANQIKGDYVHYDSLRGKVLRMKLDKVHEGIVSKGDFYVSCADFVDESGSKYDIDFMVAGDAEDLSVYQAIVHKDRSGKRPYHLENYPDSVKLQVALI